jgi:glyoxylase-like metal-dependent hydrolase (beta-lactamase superfamily II)
MARELTADQLREELESHRPVTVVDLRTTAERAEWSIPGSVHVDVGGTQRDNRSVLAQQAEHLPRDRRLVTVCGQGGSSARAAEILQDLGFDAYSLAGGMAAWSGAWNTAEVALTARGDLAIVQVRRVGKGCLSYIVGSGREAAVIDPAVDAAVYISLAQDRGWTIVAALDTHVHADHITRLYELAEQSGAKAYLPEQQRVQRPHAALKDGDELRIGSTTIRALRTPGHTHESTCYLLDEVAVCSGDTLFLNTVGRPDLAAAGAEEPAQRATALYRSLHDRLLPLRGDLLVLPGHSSAALAFDGDLFTAALSDVRAAVKLAALSEAEFVTTILGRIPPTPANHLQIVRINEGKEHMPIDPLSLEAGGNRCAISA